MIVLGLWPCWSASARSLSQSGRMVWDMNTDWAFYRGDVSGGESDTVDVSTWMPIAIPHVMRLEPKHCGGNGIYQGVGWYRRYFKLDSSLKGRRITVHFEGVMTNCEVYLNGHKLGVNHGGYLGFTVNLTPFVRWNDNNVLAVRVSAEPDPLTPPGKPQGKMDFYYYSGIYRDVRMIFTDSLYITDEMEEQIVAGGGLFISCPVVTRPMAVVKVKSHIRNEHCSPRDVRLHFCLLDKKGKIVAQQTVDTVLTASAQGEITQHLTVKNPMLWHPDHPYLYTMRVRLSVGRKLIDEISRPIGIRTIRFSTQKGFFVNGEPLYLRGANRHQAFAYVGDAASNSMQERDVLTLKKGGFNAVRAAHYPQDPAFLDACDKYGLLVVECLPSWQYFNNDSVFVARVLDAAKRMVRRDRNRPSVVLWETALNETRIPAWLARSIYEAVHSEFPGDQMYTSGDYFGNADLEPYYDVLYKQVDRFPKDGNVMSNYLEDQVVVKPLLTREWGDGAGPKPRVSLSEPEMEQIKQCFSRLNQLNGDGYFDWCMLDANPRMAGHFMWSYNDYARGCENETLFSGCVDINRFPKFSYYMLQSMRSSKRSYAGLYEGPMVFIASYNLHPTKQITVFSNADSVRLSRNGKCLGVRTRYDCSQAYASVVAKGGSPAFVFDVAAYEAGELYAQAYVNGRVAATHRVSTPGSPHHVEVRAWQENVLPVADGSDLLPVYVVVCDSAGNRVPYASNEVTLSVTGQGTLVGEGANHAHINPQRVEGGVGFALVRTTKKAGLISVRAEAEKLQPDVWQIKSVPASAVPVPDGAHPVFGGTDTVCTERVYDSLSAEKDITNVPCLPVSRVITDSSHPSYPSAHIADGDDRTWWLTADDDLPQSVTLDLGRVMHVRTARVRFQKDSSSYKHRLETSADGKNWTVLYRRECTGWDFKPLSVERDLRFFRIVFEQVSEGRAGLAEVTLY